MQIISAGVLHGLPLSTLILLGGVVALFGACFGSFLNVVIYRMPIMMQRQWRADARAYLDLEAEEPSPKIFNLAIPHSACPACSAPIRAWQNIPVVSYLLLRGKCHNCKTAISPRYPFVEVFVAFLTVLVFWQYGLVAEFFAFAFLTYVSVALVGIDIDHQLLPDDLTLPLMWVGLLVNTQGLFVGLHHAVWGAALGYGVLWAVFWLFKLVTGKEGMGYGDFKLMAAYGAWFGWQILPNTILLSSLVGAVVGGLIIWRNGKNMQTPISYGPFIAAAGWLTAMYPQYFSFANYL